MKEEGVNLTEDGKENTTQKPALLPIRASHTEFVTDKNKKDELKELMKKLKNKE